MDLANRDSPPIGGGRGSVVCERKRGMPIIKYSQVCQLHMCSGFMFIYSRAIFGSSPGVCLDRPQQQAFVTSFHARCRLQTAQQQAEGAEGGDGLEQTGVEIPTSHFHIHFLYSPPSGPTRYSPAISKFVKHFFRSTPSLNPPPSPSLYPPKINT